MKKILSSAISLILAAAVVIAVGIGSSWFVNWNVKTWFNSWGKGGAISKPDTSDSFTSSGGEDDLRGMLVEPSESSALMGLRVMALSDEESYAISPQAEKSYSLTATVLPDDATNKEVDWSVSWVNSSSSFANGKSVTDYVVVSPTADGALTATVSCLQAFGEQIVVTATVRDSADLYATCTVDYAIKYYGSNFHFSTTCDYQYSWNFTLDNINPVVDFPTTVNVQTWAIGLADSSFSSVGVERVRSDTYTKNSGYEGNKFSFAYTEDYLNALRAAGLTPKVSAEKYITLSDRSFANLFFADCVGSTPILPTTSSTWSAFRTSLRNNADKVMIRVKCVEVISLDYVVETVYNVKFSSSSLTPVATNITLGDTALEF